MNAPETPRPISDKRPFWRLDGGKSAWGALLGLILVLLLFAAPASAQSRIKDIADFEGVRDNLLVGYGLVVGLDGTGDDLDSSVFTRESLIGVLQRLGVNARDPNLDTDNVAAVMVTANLPPFARQGGRIDIAVHAIGDASSLLGGTLLVTPMLGADGEVYAVAQGALAVSGFTATGAAQSITKGVPTSGKIPNGAIIERELGFELEQLTSVKISLRNPDFTTARRVAEAINGKIGATTARPSDPATVMVSVPVNYIGDTVGMITDIEQLTVQTDQVARVIIDEASGVIVMGENVRINTVAIAQGNLTIRITETPQVQPALALLGHRRHDRRAADHHRRLRGGRPPARRAALGRQPARAGQWPERLGHRPARHDHHPAGHQGRRRPAGRHRGVVMQALAATSYDPIGQAWNDTRARIDELSKAGKGKLDERDRARIHKTAQDFEAVFLSRMIAPMFESLETDGLFGGGSGERMYRSMLVEEYGRSLARTGGVGIADSVARQIIASQEAQS